METQNDAVLKLVEANQRYRLTYATHQDQKIPMPTPSIPLASHGVIYPVTIIPFCTRFTPRMLSVARTAASFCFGVET